LGNALTTLLERQVASILQLIAQGPALLLWVKVHVAVVNCGAPSLAWQHKQLL